MNLHGSRWAPASSRTLQPALPTISHSTTPPITASPPKNAPREPELPPPPRLTSTQKQQQTRYQELLKFLKLLRRLKWKTPNLLYSHSRALQDSSATSPADEITIAGTSFPLNPPTPTPSLIIPLPEPTTAETMFKIDFFEYYALLERVLVHLLGVFGLVISASAPSDSSSTSTDVSGLIGDSRMFHGYAHRFHANVLAALDRPACPLHTTLGQGRVREYLALAKEVRNKWKDAEDYATITNGQGAEHDEYLGLRKRYGEILKDLRLEEMLRVILVQVEQARVLAVQEVERFGDADGAALGLGKAVEEFDMLDAPWEAMPDAMEWD